VYYTLGPPVFWFFSPVPISKDDVKRVAHLARIGIDSTEIDTYTADLDRILNLVEQMNKISTQGIEPLAHFPVIRDLVINMDDFMEKLTEVGLVD